MEKHQLWAGSLTVPEAHRDVTEIDRLRPHAVTLTLGSLGPAGIWVAASVTDYNARASRFSGAALLHARRAAVGPAGLEPATYGL